VSRTPSPKRPTEEDEEEFAPCAWPMQAGSMTFQIVPLIAGEDWLGIGPPLPYVGSASGLNVPTNSPSAPCNGSCGKPCKYFTKKRGCKDGDNCDHCHVCVWKPKPYMRPQRMSRRSKKSITSVELQ
jgi:hypothetical protein